MWHSVISRTRFDSSFKRDDLSSSGKWLVPVPLGDPDGLWRTLQEAALLGDLDAVKISSPRLDQILGYHLVCAYCQVSSEAYVREALGKLRSLGVTGDLNYKTDKATIERREEYLWTSATIEAPAAKNTEAQ